MGGIELDLRRAELAPVEQQLNLTAVMRGIDIRVPENRPESWHVTLEGLPLLGAIEETRKPAAASAGAAGEAAPPSGRLRVKGFALMSGIEVGT